MAECPTVYLFIYALLWMWIGLHSCEYEFVQWHSAVNCQYGRIRLEKRKDVLVQKEMTTEKPSLKVKQQFISQYHSKKF